MESTWHRHDWNILKCRERQFLLHALRYFMTIMIIYNKVICQVLLKKMESHKGSRNGQIVLDVLEISF